MVKTEFQKKKTTPISFSNFLIKKKNDDLLCFSIIIGFKSRNIGLIKKKVLKKSERNLKFEIFVLKKTRIKNYHQMKVIFGELGQ